MPCGADFLFSGVSVIIAIGGISQSGKSTLAHWLSKQLGDCPVLSQDDHVMPKDQIPKVRDRIDWECPESIDWTAWASTIQQHQHHDYLIIEGLMVFWQEPVIPDFRFWLGLDKTTFLERRRKETRWGPEPEWFLEHVWQSFIRYGQPPTDQNLKQYHALSPLQYGEILSYIRH